MTVVYPVQHIGTLTHNSDTAQNSSAITVKTGIFRFINAEAQSDHFSWGGAPDVTSDQVVHVAAGATDIFKLATPKRAGIGGATAANPCVLSLTDDQRQTEISVGDYVTISGASVGGYNFSHKEVTAVNNVTGAITIDADASALAAFTGTARAELSIKIQAKGDSTNGLTMFIDEVSIA